MIIIFANRPEPKSSNLLQPCYFATNDNIVELAFYLLKHNFTLFASR